jgi:hypothetical protein
LNFSLVTEGEVILSFRGAPPISGLPETGRFNAQAGSSRLVVARTRNPESARYRVHDDSGFRIGAMRRPE